MDLQTIIRKLELNESTISTILGGIVLLVVVFLLLTYFGSDKRSELASTTGDVNLENTPYEDTVPGSISASSVSRYTVKPGDSLWKIAVAEYGDGYKWVEIAHANATENPDLIETGQEIDLPSLQSQTEAKKPPSPKPDNYIVKRGDYLWKLAIEFYGDGFKWVDIWKANRDQVKNPDLLYVGVLLTLPD